ncbi:MAG: FecR domain-containing protein [Anaerolineae bacterium]|nr:FecR domain-containing protein [Anaerolineae bacterium]
MAWLILSTAFVTFCLLAVLVPFSIYWYVVNATVPSPVNVTSVRGTVLFGNAVGAAAEAELSSSLTDGNTTAVAELATIFTDDTSQAILTFFDDSSLTMYSNTRIVLREAREPRFGLSPNPAQITIELQQGRVRATSARSRQDVAFDILTPYAGIKLGQGSFSVEVNQAEVQVTTRLGQATVTGQGQAIVLNTSERAVVDAGSFAAPLPAAQNLLVNSDFKPDTFAETWEVYQIEPIEVVTTTVEVATFIGRDVLVLRSEGQDNVHSETGVTQQVNKDVRDFQSLRVFAEVRLMKQSLPGGGHLGSEFPIMLHVAYKDADNNDRDWFHGFYFDPPPENFVLYNQPDNSSERIARFIWYPYESVNLLTTLGPAKPVFIKSIRIYASGWIYEAMVANIYLLAQE